MQLTILLTVLLASHPIRDSIRNHPTLQYKDVVLAQSIEETGNFTSPLCRNKNNYFGMKMYRKNEYRRFATWQGSLTQFSEWQMRFISRHKISTRMDYLRYLNRIYASKPGYMNRLKIICRKICTDV